MLQHQIHDIFLPRKCELFIKCRFHFVFCSCPSSFWPFHGLQDPTSSFGCQFDRAPILQQYFGRFKLQHSSSNRNGCFSRNCTVSYLKIMQNNFDFCSQFLRDHTKTSRTFKGDFLSRCCFFVSMLFVSLYLSFFFCLTLVEVSGPFTSYWYFVLLVPRVYWQKTKPLASYPKERLASFSLSLFVSLMLSVLSQHTSRYWTLHQLMSATLCQAGSHCPQVWSMNVCSWLSDEVSLPEIIDVENKLIQRFCVFCFVWMFLQIYTVVSFHCIVHVVRTDAIPLQ